MNNLLRTRTLPAVGSLLAAAASAKSAVGQTVRTRTTGLILAATWLFCVLAAGWLTAQTSPLVPKYDDWLVIVPVVTGHQSISPAWLWENLNEHKIPLPRLALLAAMICSGGDFRAGSFLSVALLGMVSLGAMFAVRRWRGSNSIADAFFPLLMLNWGQTNIFIVGSSLNFTIPLSLFYLVAFLLVRPNGLKDARTYPAIALMLGAMALCGLVGVVLGAPILVWLGAVGLINIFVPERRRQACFWLFLALGVAALMALNFIDFTSPAPSAWPSAVFDPGSHLERARILLAMCLGWLGECNRSMAAAGIALLGFATVWALARSAVRNSEERMRYVGMIALVCALPLVMASISIGRSFLDPGALWGMTHYASLGIAFVATLYATSLFCFPRRIGSFVRAFLFLIALMVGSGNLIFPNRYPAARQAVRRIRTHEDQLVHNLVSGHSSTQAAKEFFGYQTDDRPERGGAYLEMLAAARMGPYSLSERNIRERVDSWIPRRPEDCLVLTDPLSSRYLGYGWSLAYASQGRWTCGTEATLSFRTDGTADRLLTIRFHPFLVAGKLHRQRLKLLLNGTPVWESVFDRAGVYEQTIPIPGSLLCERNVLLLQMADAAAPKSLGVNLDPDEHAFLVESFRIH